MHRDLLLVPRLLHLVLLLAHMNETKPEFILLPFQVDLLELLVLSLVCLILQHLVDYYGCKQVPLVLLCIR